MPISSRNKEFQNQYAFKLDGNVIYIANAESGRKGYLCMGCGNEMQSVRSDLQNRVSYFRHDSQYIKHKGKCTFSDETYRHKLAKEALQLAKRIKVPAIYKFPLTGIGKAVLIRESEFIEAYRVRNEIQFYEDNEGNIKWGSNRDQYKHLIIRPDVVFFDKCDNPILFIELVATHKPDQEKRLKLLRLGINAISVILPKESPEAIAGIFNITTKTKWIYNNEYESTEYIPVSNGDTEGISIIDEEQRLLFAESFKCRSAQIGNLIRRITRCVESQSYRGTSDLIKSELSRVEKNAEHVQRRLGTEADAYRRELDLREEDAESSFVRTKAGNLSILRTIEDNYTDLETRYTRKAEELDREAKILKSKIQRAIEGNGGAGKDFEQRKESYIRQRGDTDQSIESVRIRTARIITEREGLDAKYGQIRSEFIERTDESFETEKRLIAKEQEIGRILPIRFDELRKEVIVREGTLKESDEEDLRRDQNIRDTIPERFKQYERDLIKEYQAICRTTVSGIEERDYQRNPQLSEGHKRLVSGIDRFKHAVEIQRFNARSRAIKDFLAKGTYKTRI